MKSSARSSRKVVSFAVVRSYEPSRIELELLAHVFELAGRGSTGQQNSTKSGDSAASISDESLPITGTNSNSATTGLDVAMEKVA